MNEIREPSLDSRIRQMISVAAKTRDGHWRLFFIQGRRAILPNFFVQVTCLIGFFGPEVQKKPFFFCPY